MKKAPETPRFSWIELEDAVSQAVALLELLTNLAADLREDCNDSCAASVAGGLLQMGNTTKERLQAAFNDAFSSHNRPQQ